MKAVLVSMQQLKKECPVAWRELDDHESLCEIWRTAERRYTVIYTETGCRFDWTPADSWVSPDEECPW